MKKLSFPRLDTVLLIIIMVFLPANILYEYHSSGFATNSLELSDMDAISMRRSMDCEFSRGVPWYIIYAMAQCSEDGLYSDDLEDKVLAAWQKSGIDKETRRLDNDTIGNFLKTGFSDDAQDALRLIERLKKIDYIYRTGVYPLMDKSKNAADNFGAERSYGGKRLHHGSDLMCPEGIPVLASIEGRVSHIGWNELGGWRVGIRNGDTYYYYAHLKAYAKRLKKGKAVERGEVLGLAGDTGYGPEGTSGKFAPHLHFGIYHYNIPIDPYPFLRMWQTNTN